MASENTAPFYLPSADGAKLSALRRANDTLLAPRVAAITVAEGLVRELRERQPFSQGSGMGNTGNTGNDGTDNGHNGHNGHKNNKNNKNNARTATLSEAEELVRGAKAELSEAARRVQACNEEIAAQRDRNAGAAAECLAERSRTGALGAALGEVSRKRKLVEKGVEALAGQSEAQRFVGEDLRATLATSEGCKQMLDRQMAAMQDTKKEKETALDHANHLRAEVEPLRSAVKKLRTAFGAVRSATAADGGGGGSTTSSTSTSSTSTSSSADGAEEAAVEQEIRSMCMWYSEVNDLLAGVSGVSMDTAESFGATTARINIHGCETSSEGAAADVKALVVHFEPDSTRVTAAEVRSSVFLAVSRCFSNLSC